ncbi:MAG: hypothetical protein HQL67_02270 [Magnetococcales bacterium]|nr:hypothetical protein [Magnetococcales bacterium]
MGVPGFFTPSKILVLAWTFLLPTALFAEATKQAEATLPVRSVALYSSGVGYFQHAGSVQGGSELHLPLETKQISDVLKSLVMEDLDGGVPGSVLYPSENSKSRILSSFEIDLSQNPSLADIFSQLRGSQITATHQGNKLSGRLLGVEQRPVAIQKSDVAVMEWFVNLFTEEGFRSVAFSDLEQLALDDSGDRHDLVQALKALDDIRSKNSKKMVLQFPGNGLKRVRLGYVVETPTWKRSYRMILPDDTEQDGKTGLARIQGWAVVENQTDNDWQDIRLSLVSGRPISFVQDLYTPHYVQRPVIQTQEQAAIEPQPHLGGVRAVARRGLQEESASMGMTAFAKAPMNDYVEDEKGWEGHALNPAIQAAATAESVGELFNFTVDGVTLPRRRGAMISFISQSINMEKVSLYNQTSLKEHPFNGVWLSNNTDINLPSGPVTVFAGGVYGGDALLDNLPAGEKRLLSYGVDQDVAVVAQSAPKQSQISSGRIVNGVLTFTRKYQANQTFDFDNRGGDRKNLVVEYPKREGWQVAGSVQPFESTDQWHRFRVELAAKGRSQLIVEEEKVQQSRVVLVRGGLSPLLSYAREGAFSNSVRQGLNKAAELQGRVEKIRQQKTLAQQQVHELTREQERVRANLKTVDGKSRFYARMMDKMSDKETLLEENQQQIQKLDSQMDQAQKALEHYLENLVLE